MLKNIKTFFKFIAGKRLTYVSYIAVIIVSSIMNNISPYFFKLLVDNIAGKDYQILFNIVLAYLGFNIATLLVSEASFHLGNMNIIDAGAKLRRTVFAWIEDLDMAFHSEKSTGSLISAFKRGDNAFFDFSFIIHHRLLDILISFIVMFYFFVRLDPTIAYIVLAALALALISIRFLLQDQIKKRDLFNDEEDKVADIITDNLINYETVKLFAKEKWEENRLKEAFVTWKKSLWSFSNTYRVIDFVIGGIVFGGIFAVLAVSVRAVTVGTMTVGDFVLVSTFISMFFPRLWDLVWSFRDMARAYSDITKYFGLFDNEILVKDPEKPVKIDHVYGEINFDNVKFNYPKRKKNAIDGFNLKVEQGQSVALVGKSGSGKTTIAKLLMRFYDETAGGISLDGINIKDFAKSDLRNFIGVVPQEPILFNNTIEYNIGYGRQGPSLSEIRKAAKLANIDDFIESLPEKYQTVVGERGVKLSGGQKQRLAIARMILSDPDIVIFDEATSHLDSESEKLIQDAFWKARAGKTTIIIAHRLSTVMRADKIVVMQHGKIVETGTHKGLLEKKDSLYSHFWNLQIKLD